MNKFSLKELNGYLMLFFVIQLAGVVLAGFNSFDAIMGWNIIGLFKSFSFSSFVSLPLLYTLITVIDFILGICVICLFIKKNPIFVIIFIIKEIVGIISSCLALAMLPSMDVLNLVEIGASIVFSVVMLCFWTTYFKKSQDIKLYLGRKAKSSHSGKVKKYKHIRRIK